MKFEVDVRRREHTMIVRLNGELDHHTAEDLKERWEAALREHAPQHVILNLKNLDFMDSSGLGVILGRYKAIAAGGGRFVVCDVPASAGKLLEMSGLYKIVLRADDEETALAELKGGA